MEDMEASLNKLIDENIANCLMMVSTHGDVAIRQSYGRCVLRALQQPIDRVVQDVTTIFSTLLVVAEDEEATVRSALLAELPEIIIKSREIGSDDFCIYDRYLDIMLKYLEDPDPQLRKNAFYSVKLLLEKSFLDKARILGKVCPAIIGLSNLPFKNHDVDYYTNAIELMALLSSMIGQDHTEKHLLDRFCVMCENEVYSVRRWCADYMPVFCYVLGQTITEKRLLPIFKLLCEDSVWGVRKSAAKSLPKIALICSMERRRDTLAPIAFNLLNDSSRFVSGSAFKNLGQLIATFAQPCVIELEYGSSGKLYITSKQNDTKSQNSFSEEITPGTYRRDESGSLLESTEGNPFRRFLAGEPFSIQSSSPMDTQNVNAQSFQSTYTRIFSSIKRDQTESSLLDKQSEKQNLNDSICDDDERSSSGCSSASSMSGEDDNNSESNARAQEEATGGDGGGDNGGSTAEGDDLNENTKNDIEDVDDGFNDDFPDDILDVYPDCLREVLVDVRRSTNADIRQRNKDHRISMMVNAERNRNYRKAEFSARVMGTAPPAPLPDFPFGPPTAHPWRLKKKLLLCPPPKKEVQPEIKPEVQPEVQPEATSDIMIIDLTRVTLRKKGTSQINADEDSKATPSQINADEDSKATSRTVGQQTDEPPPPLNDSGDDDLQEFNSHNYWYIKPSSISIDNLIESARDLQPPVVETPCRPVPDGQAVMFNRVFDMFEIPPAHDVPDWAHKQKLDKLRANCVGPGADPKNSFFNQSIVPPYLVEYFVSMEQFADSDFNMYCVYNFPAVVLTLKKENWHLAFDLLLFLAGDIQWKVRKTIAMFICDIAVIIGREHTHHDLLPMFLAFFKDLDEVKIEALKNLPTFLTVIDIEEHPKVIANLGECLQCDNDSNWRFREELARQLLHLIKTYGHVYRVDHMIWVTGMAIALLTDKVSAVRTVAMDAIAEKCCNSSPIELKYLVEFLVEDFAHHIHWRRRQMFLNICQELISKDNSPSIEVIESNFLPHILELAKDKIPNIRLAVVRVLSLLLSYNPQLNFMLDHPILETMITLQCDVDNDVKFLANDR